MIEPKEQEDSASEYAPKPLSVRQNVLMTVKVLGGAAILLALLWLASSQVAP